MTTHDLRLGFAVCQNQLVHFLSGITPELAARPTCNGGNPVNWILGHVLAERVEAAERMGVEPPATIPDLSRYVTGTKPDPSTALPFDDLVKLIPLTHELLLDALQTLTEADLAASAAETFLGKPSTESDQLLAFPLHEMYHIGQISLARYSLGLGAVTT